MSTTFRAYNPEQMLLLPPNLKEWLPEGHLSHFISDTVDELSLKKFYEKYEGDGRRKSPYAPRMMLKVLLYGYCTGVFSSRKIAKRIEEEVAFRYLAAGNFPNFRTINTFRKENLKNFQDLFMQVVRVAKEVGLVRLGIVAVDGSKMKANASKRKAMSYGRMKEEGSRLEKEIADILDEVEHIDEEEDRLFGVDERGDELPDELAFRESRLEKIREAKKRLEERQKRKDEERGRHDGDDNNASGIRPQGGRSKFQRDFGVPEDKAQDNFTDPESRIMKTSNAGYQQAYNGQIAVDEKHQLIIANRVSDNPSDTDALIPLLEQVKKNTGKNPKNVLGDSGFRSEENFKALRRKKILGIIALGRECKESQQICKDLKLTREMARLLKTKRGRNLYRKRKAIVEAPFGWIKSVLGFIAFSLRSKWKVESEWSLVCCAVNLKRMAKLIQWQHL